MIAPMVIAGAGFAAAITTTQVTLLNAVPPRDIGTASGTLSTLRQREETAGRKAGTGASPPIQRVGVVGVVARCAQCESAGCSAGGFAPGPPWALIVVVLTRYWSRDGVGMPSPLSRRPRIVPKMEGSTVSGSASCSMAMPLESASTATAS
jgi:hypothetical protein